MAQNFINYRLCRLAKGKRWHIEYYAYDPLEAKPVRTRLYLNHIKDIRARLQTARLLMQQINLKLINGWSPFVAEGEPVKPLTITEAIEKIYRLKTTGAEARTVTTYRSRVKKFTEWLKETRLSEIYLHQFTKQMATAYMDSLRLSGIGNRTYNGYLTDMRTFFNAMAERDMIRANHFREIKMQRTDDKLRNSFTDSELTRLNDYLAENNLWFLLCCYYCYYAVLRPVEICRMKVADINLQRGYIRIGTHQSKNDKAQTIPLLPPLAALLRKMEIENYPPQFYLVSAGFAPGEKKIRENQIAKYFKKLAATLKLPEHTTFYSLKDTVAERLITAGYDIKFIQRFFRHSDITMTDAYMSKFNPVLDMKLIEKFPVF